MRFERMFCLTLKHYATPHRSLLTWLKEIVYASSAVFTNLPPAGWSSEVVKDFEQSLENLRPSTRRVYVAGARAAIRAASLELWQSPSTNELLASIGKSPTGKRISPFLAFLGGGGPKQSVSSEDLASLQNWVIQTIAKQMRFVKNPSIASRRDTALIAAICAAPARGTPRKWPQNCLKIGV
jgi:hypothetical protein